VTPVDRRAVGYAEALAAAVLWGSSGIFSAHLLAMGLPPLSIALLRPVIGVGFLVVMVAVLRRRARVRVGARGATVLVVVGGSLVGTFQIAYQMSIDAVGVPSTVALVYLAPAIVVAASGPMLDEWPTARRIGLAGTTLVGVWLTVLGAESVVPAFGGAGVAWGILAGVTYAGYTLFGRYATPRYGSASTVLYTVTGACLWLVAITPWMTDDLVWPGSLEAWALLSLFALVTIAGAQFLYFDALGRIEAGRAAITSAAEPVVAAVLATALLAQGLSPVGWLGVGVVVIGVAGVSSTASRTNARP
jgi:DME family drug/metabolite transporter